MEAQNNETPATHALTELKGLRKESLQWLKALHKLKRETGTPVLSELSASCASFVSDLESFCNEATVSVAAARSVGRAARSSLTPARPVQPSGQLFGWHSVLTSTHKHWERNLTRMASALSSQQKLRAALRAEANRRVATISSELELDEQQPVPALNLAALPQPKARSKTSTDSDLISNRSAFSLVTEKGDGSHRSHAVKKTPRLPPSLALEAKPSAAEIQYAIQVLNRAKLLSPKSREVLLTQVKPPEPSQPTLEEELEVALKAHEELPLQDVALEDLLNCPDLSKIEFQDAEEKSEPALHTDKDWKALFIESPVSCAKLPKPKKLAGHTDYHSTGISSSKGTSGWCPRISMRTAESPSSHRVLTPKQVSQPL